MPYVEGREGGKIQICIRLPLSLEEKMHLEAAKRRITRSGIIEKALEKYLEEAPPDAPVPSLKPTPRSKDPDGPRTPQGRRPGTNKGVKLGPSGPRTPKAEKVA